jgi:hypothetical protein
MLVMLYKIYEGREVHVRGTIDEVEKKLLAMFPHLDTGDPEHEGDIKGLLEAVDAIQAWSVEGVQVEGDESLDGPEDDPDYNPDALLGEVREVIASPDLLMDNAGSMHVDEPSDD